MAKRKATAEALDSTQPNPVIAAIPTPSPEGEWLRLRRVNERGVPGYVLEQLTVAGDALLVERLHDVDMRDAALGKLVRVVELGA